MDLNIDYRIPKKEEFIKGFKFEYLQTSGGSSWFFMNAPDLPSIDEQIKANEQPIIQTWVDLEFDNIFDCPIALDYSLENNLIRCKKE